MSECVGVKWKTKNGINYPEGLEKMSFTHELSVEERYNLIEAYILGYDEGKAERRDNPPEKLTDVKGHWIDRSAGEYRCSNCGVKIGETDITDHPINSFNYCPYCGSDMRKGDVK